MGDHFQLDNERAWIGQGANSYKILKSRMSVTNKSVHLCRAQDSFRWWIRYILFKNTSILKRYCTKKAEGYAVMCLCLDLTFLWKPERTEEKQILPLKIHFVDLLYLWMDCFVFHIKGVTGGYQAELVHGNYWKRCLKGSHCSGDLQLKNWYGS